MISSLAIQVEHYHVEATRRNRPVDEVVIKKRRSREKQHNEKQTTDDNQKKSRVRREPFTGYASSFRLLGVLVMISSLIAVLPIRGGVETLRFFFLR